MANWKKVIVSGSAAELASLSLDTALPVGSGGTGASTLTNGGILLGSNTGAVTALAQATNGQLVVGSTGTDPVLATLTGGANITVTNTAGAISIAASGLGSGTVQSVAATGTENGITLTSDGDSVNPTITLGGALANVTNAQLSNSSVTLGTTEVALGATATTLAGLTLTTAVITGSFTGSFTGTTNLPDLTDGSGISDFTYDGSTAASISVQNDGSTLTVGGAGVKVADAGITATQIATSVAGAGLSGGAGTALSVNVDDTSIEITTDTLNIKDLGVTNAMLAGSIVNAKLVNDSVTLGTTEVNLGTTAASLAGLTLTGATVSGSFTGSFTGDGSNLTGIATDLDTSGNSGAGNINLVTQGLAVTGAGAISTVAAAQGIAISVADGSSSQKGAVSFASSNFSVTNGDVSLAQDVSIGRDLVVTRNLTVVGTASFNNETNLDVADRFIRMASGSEATGDGGIAIQQTGPTDAEAFGWDSNIARWGVTGSFDAAQNSLVPDAFFSLITDGGVSNDPTATPAKYTKNGNMFIGGDDNIWIYS